VMAPTPITAPPRARLWLRCRSSTVCQGEIVAGQDWASEDFLRAAVTRPRQSTSRNRSTEEAWRPKRAQPCPRQGRYAQALGGFPGHERVMEDGGDQGDDCDDEQQPWHLPRHGPLCRSLPRVIGASPKRAPDPISTSTTSTYSGDALLARAPRGAVRVLRVGLSGCRYAG
jgi:hypothetical protein